MPPSGKSGAFAGKAADLASERLFAVTRRPAVAPWSEDVKAKPMFAASDGTGTVAAKLAATAFMQFGSREKAVVRLVPGIQDKAAVLGVVEEAAKTAPSGSLAIEMSGAIIVYTLADPKLSKFLAEEGYKRGVPCLNALEPVLQAMERSFNVERSRVFGAEGEASEEPAGALYAVSDSTCENSYSIVCAALQQFPGCGIKDVAVCSEVRTLEDVNSIVDEAKGCGGLVVFTFASPGLSRFMQQQCERAGVPYADAFQPLLIALEKYLAYPPVSVPGGHRVQSSTQKWERRSVLPK